MSSRFISKLVGRLLTPCSLGIPETARYTHLHQGHGNPPDHMLISRALIGTFRPAENHNETLHDESLPLAFERKFPESDHAPFVMELGLQPIQRLTTKTPRPLSVVWNWIRDRSSRLPPARV